MLAVHAHLFQQVICSEYDSMIPAKMQNMTGMMQSIKCYLDHQEQVPVVIPERNYRKLLRSFLCLQFAHLFLKKMERTAELPSAEMTAIRWRVVAMNYRKESRNGGLDKQPGSSVLCEQIKKIAFVWKQKQLIFKGSENLTECEMHRLREATSYPHFIQLLLQDSDLQELFFNWTLRDRNLPGVFIEYPCLQARITECLLSARVGFYGGGGLKINKLELGNGSFLKEVTLIFENRAISILNENTVVHFIKGGSATIREVFEEFKSKKKKWGEFEFGMKGVYKWHCGVTGYHEPHKKDPIRMDLTEPFPPVAYLTTEEIDRRYHHVPRENKWMISMMSNRQYDNFGPFSTHTWIEWVRPVGEGKYAFHSAGKFPIVFPMNTLEFYQGIVSTEAGIIAYPDMNIFATHRQLTNRSFCVTAEQGKQFEELVKYEISKGRNSNLAYQFLIHNCALWSWKVVSKVIGRDVLPNLFKVDFFETELTGPMNFVFNQVKKLPVNVRNKVMTIFFLILGSWKNKVLLKKDGRSQRICVWDTPPWSGDIMVIHPGLLFKQKC